MRRFSSVLLAILVLFLGSSVALGKDQIPTLQASDRGWVDTTGTVSSSTLNALRDQSARINGEGFQLAGAFFKDIDSDPAQFATNFGNQNGIGFADKDNGLSIIVLLDRAGTDGHKPYIFVATGRGMEGLLPDSKITEYRNKYFNPLRAQGKWEQGLIQLSTAFADFLGGSTAQEFRTNPNSSQPMPTAVLIVLGGILLVIFVVGLGVVIYYFFFRTPDEPSEDSETYQEPAYAPVETAIDDSVAPATTTRRRRRRKTYSDDSLPLAQEESSPDDGKKSRQAEEDEAAAEEERQREQKRRDEEDEEEEESNRHREEEDSFHSSGFGSESSPFGGGFGGGGGSFGGGGSGG